MLAPATHPPRDSREEFANTLTHACGLVLSLAGSTLLVFAAASPAAAFACALYALTLIATYAASSFSHAARCPELKGKLIVWDQAVIYLLIVGTYTPILMHYLPPSWVVPTIALLWTAAVLGFLSKVVAKHRIGSDFSPLSYVALGWIPAMILMGHVPAECVAGMAAGGVLYTVGVVFLTLDRRVRYFHAAWHLFVIAGSTAHYFTILYFVAMAGSAA